MDVPQVTIQAPVVNIYLSSAGITSADLTAALAPILERLMTTETGLEAVQREVGETGAAIEAATTAVNAAATNMTNAATEMTAAAQILPALKAALDEAVKNNSSDPALQTAAAKLDEFQTKLGSSVSSMTTAGESLTAAGSALANALAGVNPEPAPVLSAAETQANAQVSQDEVDAEARHQAGQV